MPSFISTSIFERNPILRSLDIFEKVITGLGCLGVIMIMTATAVTRYMSVQFLGYEEVVKFVACWMFMFGAVRATRTETLISAEMADAFITNPKILMVIKSIASILSTLLAAIYTVINFQYFALALQRGQVTTVYHIPVSIYYSIISFCVGLMAIYIAIHCFITLRESWFFFKGRENGEEENY